MPSAAPPSPGPAILLTPPPGAQPTAGLALVIDGRVRIPAGIGNLEAFRSWARSDESPEHIRLAYLHGTLWVDLTMEQLYTHNQVKAEVGVVLGGLVKASGLGRYLPDGVLLSNPAADLSTVPDGLFVSYAALQSARVCRVPGRQTGVVELEGSPEMVLEVVSDSSVEKDMVLLPELYRRAGVTEFWRADARGDLHFEVLRLTEAGYVPTQEPDGWWRSEVFGRSFRLTHQADLLGDPQFTLDARE